MSTLITTPFGAEPTAAEVVAGIDLSGKRMVVTGGASGIGIETARALAQAGAEVTIAVRDTEAGERVVRVAPLELTDLASVRGFVDAWDGPLHVLVNNAGVMAVQELELTPAGLERQFATNHVGHFALATGLHDALASAGGDARIVSVSSRGHLASPVVFDDLNFENREYTPFGAYGQSKTANVLFAVGATNRWAGDGITANALMLGGIATPLQRHLPEGWIEQRLKQAEEAGNPVTMKSPEQGPRPRCCWLLPPTRGHWRVATSRTATSRDARARRRAGTRGRRGRLRHRPRQRRPVVGAVAGADRLRPRQQRG